MNLNELFSQYMEYDGSIDRSDVGAMLHMFVPSSMDAAEKIYKALLDEDIHEAYEEYLEDCEEELDEYSLCGFTICVVVMESRIGATICLSAENESEIRDLEESEIRLTAELSDVLLDKVQ